VLQSAKRRVSLFFSHVKCRQKSQNAKFLKLSIKYFSFSFLFLSGRKVKIDVVQMKTSFFCQKIIVLAVGGGRGATTFSRMTLNLTTLSIKHSLADLYSMLMLSVTIKSFMPSVIIMSVIMLSVIPVSVILVSVILVSVILVSVILLSVILLSVVMQSVAHETIMHNALILSAAI
jgi:hypothetical protein